MRSISAKTPVIALIEYTKAMRDRPSREEFLEKYPSSTLILSGDKDEIIPLEVIKKMAPNGSKSIFFALPDTGHMVMIESDLLAIEKIGEFILS